MDFDVTKLKVNESKEELERRGLDTNGLADLVERLRAALEEESQTEPLGPAKQEEDEYCQEDQDNEGELTEQQESVEDYGDSDGNGDDDVPQGDYEDGDGKTHERQPTYDTVHKSINMPEEETKTIPEIKQEYKVEVKTENDDAEQNNHRSEQQQQHELEEGSPIEVKTESDKSGHYGRKRPHEENRGYDYYEHREEKRSRTPKRPAEDEEKIDLVTIDTFAKMLEAPQKTKYTSDEALEFVLESGTDSEDSQYDSEAEDMFLEGLDPVYDHDNEPEGVDTAPGEPEGMDTAQGELSTSQPSPAATTSRRTGSRSAKRKRADQLQLPQNEPVSDHEDSDWEPETAASSRPPSAASTSGRSGGRGRGSRGVQTGRGAQRAVPSPAPQPQRWYSEKEEDLQPPTLTFSPNRQPGPQARGRRGDTVLDFFRLFFTNLALKTLLDNTNEYGQKLFQAQGVTWQDFTMPDMNSFLALVIYMGLVPVRVLKHFWRQHRLYSLPYPPSVMARNKFLKMARCLHMCSVQDDALNQAARGTPGYDRLREIKPLYTQIVQACKNNFHPHQNISIDERMIASKARTPLKQYIKNKPTKWGYKLFVLADSKTGYTWNFFVYEGKSTTNSTISKGLSYDSVMSLMDIRTLGEGYHLYVDNFYTSAHLFRDLFVQKIGACGTMRPIRVGFPKTTENDLCKKDPRGSIRWIRDNDLLFVKWKDTREVVLCSTIHAAYTGETVQRRVKEGETWIRKDVPVPAAVKAYNCHMGGVDLSNALLGYFSVLHKTRKWHRTLFYHFVDIAVVNAFVLYNCHHKGNKITQEKFRERLIEELVAQGSPSTSTTASAQRCTPTSVNLVHCLAYLTEGQFNGKDHRRRCALCKRKITVGCETCAVPLCFERDRNCYKDWHK